MISHYNAFISYRHAPQDIKVAAEVQRRLEQFKVPAAIRKATGLKKIDRIFRDKEELPITSDLNQTIENALNNSDYLIVICSHSTKESIWVQREIEFFLKTHSRKQVLTVLVDGEPGDVIPEILQYEEATVMLDSGETQVVRVPIEPLSCDYRGDFKKARREELPRLAAALLGCSYDDLKRRQRQYKMRRLTIAVSAVMTCMIALSVYFAWSANQIQSNYEQSLISQSKYLSSESLALLEEGDRITAMLLALEALPKDGDDDRPVIPQAEYALSQAVNAYVNPEANSMRIENSYVHGGTISEFILSQNEKLLFVSHSDNKVTVWDADSYMQLQELTLPTTVQQIASTKENNLLVLCAQQLYCYQPETGVELWSLSLSPYKETIGYTYAMAASGADSVLACMAGKYLVTIDSINGQVIKDVLLPTYESSYSDDLYSYDIEMLQFTSDGQFLLLALDDGLSLFPSICNLEDMQITMSPETMDTIDRMLFTGDSLLITGLRYLSPYCNTRIESTYIYFDSASSVLCLNLDGSLRWERKLDYVEFDVGHEYELLYYDYVTEEGDVIPAIITTAGENMGISNIATGDTLGYVEYPSVLASLYVQDGIFHSIHVDGSWFTYDPATDELLSTFCYVNDFDTAVSYDSATYVVLEDEGTILRYVSDLYDTNWAPVESDVVYEDYLAILGFIYNDSYEDRILLYKSRSFDQPFVVIFGDENRYVTYPALPEEYTENYMYYIGFDSTGENLLFTYESDTQDSIAAFNLATGTFDPNYMSLTYDFYGASYDTVYLSDSLFLYETIQIVNDALETSYVCRYPNGSEVLIPNTLSLYTDILYVNNQETFALIRDYEYKYALLDLKNQTLCEGVSFTEEASEPLVCWTDTEKEFIIATQNQIHLYDASFTERLAIPCNGMTPQAIHCVDQVLYVIYSGNEMYCYSLIDGSFLSKIDIELTSYVNNVRWSIMPNGDLAVLSQQKLNIIDTKEYTLKTNVDYCLGCDVKEQRVYVGMHNDNDELTMGSFHLYTYEELIAMAKKQLGNTVLTPQQKSKYGIN